MGDCMSYPDKAMDFIKGYSFKDKHELYTNGADLVPVFRVEQMLEHHIPGWIPVSERLPEPNLIVLCSTICGTVDTDFYGKMTKQFQKAGASGKKVIAWMPLPEPYKPQFRGGVG